MRIRERITYANVMATIAVFLAIGGTAAAALSGKEKKTVKKLARAEIAAQASSLSVAHAKVADSANTANTAGSASTATSADKVDGTDICRTEGVLTMNRDDADVPICTAGSLSVVARCYSSGTDTIAQLNANGNIFFGNSTTGGDGDFPTGGIITAPNDTTADAFAVVANAAAFSAGSLTSNDQITGTAVARAFKTSDSAGTCKFVVGATN